MSAADRARLHALVAEHHAAVRRYVTRRAPPDAVEDALADTFLVAWRRLDDVPADARPWLLGVARRVIATHARADRRRTALRQRLLAHAADTAPRLDETETPIARAFAQLSVQDQEILMLVAVEEMSCEEAAVVLGGLPASTARSRLTRARRRLAQALATDELEQGARSRSTARPKEDAT